MSEAQVNTNISETKKKQGHCPDVSKTVDCSTLADQQQRNIIELYFVNTTTTTANTSSTGGSSSSSSNNNNDIHICILS